MRAAFDLGVPESRPGSVAYWRSLVCRALAAAHGDRPGPVQVNVGLREPLVPDGDESWPEPLDGREGGAPWTARVAAVAAEVADDLPARTVVVVGDADPGVTAQAVALAAARGLAGRRRAVGVGGGGGAAGG